MKKIYAKNPIEVAEMIIDNPAPKNKVKKDPRRVAAGNKSWKTRQRKTKNKTKPRMNTEKYASTGKKMILKTGLAAVGTIGGVRVTQILLDKFGQALPAAVRTYMPIAAPAIVGIIVGTKAKQKNHVAQGVATGLVYASVSTAMNRFLPSAVTGQEGLSDAMGYNNSSMLADVEPGSLVVSPSGEVQDLQGNLYGKAVLQLEEPKETTSVRANSLELAESWENGEQF